MKKKIRVAAVGVGHLGQHHARIYSEHNDCELVAVIDNSIKRAEEIAAKYGVPFRGDYQDTSLDVDAVSVATPTSSHYEIARYFLERGVHVLLEKPICERLEDGRELVETAHRKGLIFQIGHLERFNAAILEASRLISNPGFMEVQRLGHFSPRSLDIDVILDLMIHDIDIVLSLMKNTPIKSISAVGVPVITDKIDIANARLVFEGGCVVNMTASRASLEKTRKIRIFQKNLYLSVDYAAQNLFVVKRLPPVGDGPMSFPRIVKEDVAITPHEPLKAEIDAFLSAIQSGVPPVVSGEDGLAALEIAYTIRECI